MRPTVVAHPTTGEIITINPNKPEFATFRVDSEEVVCINNFFDIRRRVAFVTGPTKVIQKMVTSAGQVMEGKIIMLESFNPFYPNQEPKMNTSVNPPVEVRKDGKPVYMEFVYDRTGLLHDAWVENAPEVPATSPQEQGAPQNAETPQGATAAETQTGF